MKKDLSRAETGRVIGDKTERMLLATSFLFLAAGSLWSHLGLGPVVFEIPFVATWSVVHLGAFFTLTGRRAVGFIVASSFVGLQIYFEAALRRYSLPYLPMAPVFFIVSTLALQGFAWARGRAAVGFWALGWLSTLLWVKSSQAGDDMGRTALLIAMGLSALFVGGFIALFRFFSKRMTTLVETLGPKNRFDDQRIHAASLQSLGELAAGLSHEIQNPLAAINGYSYQIQEEVTAPTSDSTGVIRKANERIKFNVDRIIEIARVMRNFSRETSGDEKAVISVQNTLRDALALMVHSFKTNGVELQVDLPADDIKIRGHFVQISQVLVNLMSNARDACMGSERRVVKVGFTPVNGRVELWVEDTGPGISDAIRRDVFKAFFTTKPAGIGTGMGLYIAGIIAERHAADLRFECPRDTSGRILGTRFTLSFAVVEAASQQAA